MFGPGLGRKIGKKAPRRIAENGTEPGSGAELKSRRDRRSRLFFYVPLEVLHLNDAHGPAPHALTNEFPTPGTTSS
jgi:hypothetical protein